MNKLILLNLCVFLLSSSTSCSFGIPMGEVNQPITCRTGQPIREEYTQKSIAKVDYLFIINNSKSMNFHSQHLERSIFGTINQLVRTNHDYHIGFVTTGTTQKTLKGCLIGKTKFIEPTTPNLLQKVRENSSIAYVSNQSSAGLDTLLEAIDKQNSCNSNFFRDDAFLVVIFISNETDQSTFPVERYVRQLKSFKVSQNRIRISLAGTKPNNKCLLDGKLLPNMPRYQYLSQQFKGDIASFCNISWGTSICQGGCSSKYFPFHADFRNYGVKRFILSYQAVPNTIQISINGKDSGEYSYLSWSYEDVEKAIVFKTTFDRYDLSNFYPPTPNANIRVKYLPLCP